MRIAIFLSGQARKFQECSQFLRKAVSDHEVDYYIHTWNTSGPVLIESRKDRYVGDVIPDDFAQSLLEAYRPKGVCIEPPISFTEYNLDKNHGKPSVTNQSEQSFWSYMYSRKKSYELMHQEYDAYAWIRTDVRLHDKIPINIEDGVFYTAWVGGPEWNTTHMNTMFVLTKNIEYIEAYLTVYDKVLDLYNTGVQFCDHRLSMASLSQTNAKYAQIMQNSWELVRNV